MAHPLDDHPLRTLFRRTPVGGQRASSWDRTGGNDDFIRIAPGETATLLEHDGAGCINRIYMRARRARADRLPRRDPALLLGRRGDAVGRGAARRLLRRHARAHPRVPQRVHRREPRHRCVARPERVLPDAVRDRARASAREPRPTRSSAGLLGMVWFHVEYETFADAAARRRAAVPRAVPAGAPDRTGDRSRSRTPAARRRQPRRRRELRRTRRDGRRARWSVSCSRSRTSRAAGTARATTWCSSTATPGRPASTAPGTRRSSAAARARRASTRRRTRGFHLVESRRLRGLVGAYRWYVADPIRFDAVDPLDDRARPRQQLREQLRVGRVLVPERAARAVSRRCRRATRMRPPLPADFDQVRIEVLTGMAKLTRPGREPRHDRAIRRAVLPRRVRGGAGAPPFAQLAVTEPGERGMGTNQRAQIVMTDDEIAEFIEHSRTATMATVGPNGTPHLVAMWYAVIDGQIWFETKAPVAEGGQPAARPAHHRVDRGRLHLRHAARRVDRGHGRRSSRTPTRSGRSASTCGSATTARTPTR